MQLTALLPQICTIARQAGEKIMTIYQDPTQWEVASKADESPITQADLAAHHHIVQALEQLTTVYPVVSEESALDEYSTRAQWTHYWLVDPLDGTKEFINRTGEFTVNIALIANNQPVLGVVYVPAQQRMFYAAQGCGAWLVEAEQAPQALSSRPLSEPTGVRVVASRRHGAAAVEALLQKLPGHQCCSIGSSLKFCLLAQGEADLYPRLGPTSEWDTAAAQCVLEQAGGAVVDLKGQPLRYNTKADILNPHFYALGDANAPWLTWLGER